MWMLKSHFQTSNPVTITAVLRELLKRHRLTIALKNCPEATIKTLVETTRKYVSDPMYVDVLLEVSKTIIRKIFVYVV